MKTRILAKLAGAALLVGAMSSANAVENVFLTAPGPVAPGSTINLSFDIDFTGMSTTGGGTDLFFDPAVFDFVSWTITSSNNDSFFTDQFPVQDCSTETCSANASSGGMTPQVAHVSFGNFSNPYSGMHVIGELVLQIAAGAAPGFYNIDMFGSNDASGEPGPVAGDNVQYLGGTVQVVPVPAAAWLMISGLAGLLGFARRGAIMA